MAKKHKKHHKSDKEEREDKPLKLVLKVGGSSDVTESVVSEQPDSERKHKHKKKKKKHKHEKEREHKHEKKEKEKRKHEEVELEEMEVSEGESEPPTKKIAVVVSSEEIPGPPRPQKDRKLTEEDRLALQKCLDYLHKILSRKDVNGFFAYPVTDQIAPGYSVIIKQPMDLSTIREKVDNSDYSNVMEYKRDFLLMCDNCMTYNHPETVFYKEAKRLHTGACKQITKDKLWQMKKNLPFMSTIGESQMGLETEEGSEGGEELPINVHTKMPVGQESPAPVSPQPESEVEVEAEDSMSPEEILAQAQAAAKGAADRLTLRRPNSKFGFLKRRADGSTTLNILNPDNEGIVSETERIVSLGSLAGKIQSGTGSLAGFKEDKRNKATPVNYLNYGPFSSYAPVYDSSSATVSKEESDLLLTTYGDEMGIQYSKSVQHFVKDCGDYCVRYVDNLLDIITGNEHSKAKEVLEERQKEAEEKKRQEEEKDKMEAPVVKTEVDLDSLRSLSDLGIDMSFLDDPKSQVDSKLQETSDLIGDLHKAQNERLSKPPPAHFANIPGPSEKEVELANKLTKGLTDLVKQATPSDIVSAEAVRSTMGITIKPDPDSSQSDPETNTDAANLGMELEDFLGQGTSS